MIGNTKSRKIFSVYDGDRFLDVGTAEEVAEKWGYTVDYVNSIASASMMKRRSKVKKPQRGERLYYVGEEPVSTNERMREYAWRKGMLTEVEMEKEGISEYLLGKSKCFEDIEVATKEYDIGEEGLAKIRDWSDAYLAECSLFSEGYKDALQEAKNIMRKYKRQERELCEAEEDSDAL